MRFRLGLVLGFLVGYVLGAQAGRQRYEQIMRWLRSISRSEPAQQISAEVREAASRAGDSLETKAAEQVTKVTNLVRGEENPNGGGSQGATLPPS